LSNLNLPVDLVEELIDRDIAVSFEKDAMAFCEDRDQRISVFPNSAWAEKGKVWYKGGSCPSSSPYAPPSQQSAANRRCLGERLFF
jgi:hypothetical protein